jgi:arylsulfatase A-like enzyme
MGEDANLDHAPRTLENRSLSETKENQTMTKQISKLKWITVVVAMGITVAVHAAEKPNIVLILADDMGWGDAGFNGCKDIPTPAIDSIAAGGVRFTEGYVMAPQCAPSRAALLTGVDQNRIPANSNVTMNIIGLPEHVTMPDLLRKAGYRTGMVGKWHLGDNEGKHPMDRGFDSFFGFLGGSSPYYPPGNRDSIANILDGREPVKVARYLTDEFGDRAVEFIKNSEPKAQGLKPRTSSPFFLYLSFNAPHTPMQAPKEEIAKFAGLKQKHELRPTYAAMVTVMDRNIQKVLDAIDSAGVADNTLVVFLSDNGGPEPHSGCDNGPLRGIKGDTLEGGIRVPFAMKWPAVIPAATEIGQPVLSIDLLPTSLAAAGTDIPHGLQGINLLPALTGNAEVPERVLNFLFTHSPNNSHRWRWAVRDGDWKLVFFDPRDGGRDQTALFNLSDDLGEQNDLTASHPEIRERLQNTHDAWFNALPEPFSNLDPVAYETHREAKLRELEANRRRKERAEQ